MLRHRMWLAFFGFVAIVAAIVLLPSLALAQGTLTGTVKDASGAVLPGVTVEASSPALIEKVRTVTTDGQGLYSIIDLRPGRYEVTFSLAAAPWVPGGLTTLGTDGFGRSDTRERLRRFFEVDAESIVIATLYALSEKGKLEKGTVAKAIKELGVDPEKTYPQIV